MSFKISHFLLAVTALGLVFVSAPACASDGWGAIAIDVTQSSAAPSFGVGGGANEDEASGNAIKFCHETGSKTGCKIMVTYQACAIASNGSDAGWA